MIFSETAAHFRDHALVQAARWLAPVACCSDERATQGADIIGLEQCMMLPRYLEDLDIRTSTPPSVVIPAVSAVRSRTAGDFNATGS